MRILLKFSGSFLRCSNNNHSSCNDFATENYATSIMQIWIFRSSSQVCKCFLLHFLGMINAISMNFFYFKSLFDWLGMKNNKLTCVKKKLFPDLSLFLPAFRFRSRFLFQDEIFMLRGPLQHIFISISSDFFPFNFCFY